jgi:hypothetical protein
MEAFGKVILWVIKVFLLLFGFVLLLGGGFCAVLPLFEATGGYGAVSAVIGLVALLIGGLTFWAALRMIRPRDAGTDQQDKDK